MSRSKRIFPSIICISGDSNPDLPCVWARNLELFFSFSFLLHALLQKASQIWVAIWTDGLAVRLASTLALSLWFLFHAVASDSSWGSRLGPLSHPALQWLCLFLVVKAGTPGRPPVPVWPASLASSHHRLLLCVVHSSWAHRPPCCAVTVPGTPHPGVFAVLLGKLSPRQPPGLFSSSTRRLFGGS